MMGESLTEISNEKQRRQDIGALLFLTSLVALFFSPSLFQGKIFFYFDFSFITAPSRFFLKQVMEEGAIAFWNPHIYHGEPFMAGYHSGVFYPPSLLLLVGDFATGLNLFYVSHFWFLALSVYILVRSWKLSTGAALCASVTATFSGFFLSITLINNYFFGSLWFPFILFCFQQLWNTQRGVFFFLGTLGIAFQTLAGLPSCSVMTVVLVFCDLWHQRRPNGWSFNQFLKPMVVLGLAVALSLGLAAIQLVPTYKLISHSERKAGLNYEEHAMWSVGPSQASELVLPKPLNGFLDRKANLKDTPRHLKDGADLVLSMYMGLGALLFMVLGFRFLKSPPVRFWMIVFWVGLFLSAGKYNPLYPYIYEYAPLVKSLRYPEKYFFLCAHALVFLMAFVIDELSRTGKTRKMGPGFLAGAILLVASLVLMVGSWIPTRSISIALGWLAVMGLVLVAVRFRKISPAYFKGYALALIVFDLGFHNFQVPPMVSSEFFVGRPALIQNLPKEKQPVRWYSGPIEREWKNFYLPNAPNRFLAQLVWVEYLNPFTGFMHGIEYVNGLGKVNMALSKTVLWEEIFFKSTPEKKRRVLERSNTRYWIDQDQPTRFADDTPVILPDRRKQFNNTLPRAFIVGKATNAKPVYLLNTYYSEEFDPLKEVLLEEEIALAEKEGFNGQVTSLEYAPNRVQLRTQQNSEGVLVLLDAWFPGWSATVDGQPVKILRANHFFRGIPLSAGEHVVEFEFVPEGYQTGLTIAGISLFLMPLVAFFGPRRNWLDRTKNLQKSTS